ncbi:hypothetical protein FSPOR_8323 [Fusarium sporotrichioides]|uniref:DUF7908 domain-containing protein n=1 Tax=Fusarium sporotrichioides TaxID=5514 RepID=A0A395RV49_FUSSP|nr:hypothetical protein FSPOR_8323 [Fusarium sporotrichioides]
MVAKTLVAAVLAAYVAAGPCKPKSQASDIFSISSEFTIEPTTPVETATSDQTTTKTTEVVSTSSFSTPAGEAIILQVNPQRRLAKRDTTFIGNNNPTSCDFATVFRIDSEQLLQDEVPIYYQNEGYQELAAQGTPPAVAITRAFSISGGYLSWINPAFGEAGFCQTPSDGKVYITFGSNPTGCQSVTLTAYKESQCQNGYIVDPEASSAESTSIGVTTSAGSISKDTSSTEVTAQENTSGEVTTSDVVTSRPLEEVSSTEATETTQELTSTETTSQAAGVTSSVNVCVDGLRDPNGQPDLQSRISDCSAYNTVTVSPFTSTATVVKRRVYYQIPTAWATPQPKITKRADDPTDTTIFPTIVPSYATYCDSPSEYYEACSEAGVTAFTTTLPEPDTTTTTSTSNGCGPLSKFKRGVEYLGYTLSEDWDRAIFTGVVLHERFHD